ncbi:MAG: AMP-binding protein, partial [Actinobacteria bacterium]|nr:AMP-binding protein [Actinomycetota bacterium]
RLGALHTVVFGGFSSTALSDRILDCDARVVITSDGGYRRGAASALKPAVDEALLKCPDVRSVLVVRRTGQEVEWDAERDVWWHELVDGQSPEHEPEAFDAEHPLFVMYTSGSTGKPKGILHTTGGYLLGSALTTRWVFDLKPDDTYWCTADVGWVTGPHTQRDQRVGRPAHLVLQLRVGDRTGVTRLPFPVVGHLVAVTVLHVPVDAVVGDVQPATHEPLRHRRVRPVEHL